MTVSCGLQKYFDAQRSQKKDTTSAQLEAISAHVDPIFMQSFEEFRARILDIVDEDPDCEDIVSEELGELDSQMQERKRVHNMQSSKAIIEAFEKRK
ncbi:hypothetical protein GW846_01095 [Candidatus Gracilibacteria bacterium]|nr:hypothetical protein [Candidatus Gracilibacteria bacterium]